MATIKWLRSKGKHFDQFCVADAAGRGHLEAIKEMRRSKARGTDESSRARWSEEAVEEAAKGGHLEVVQWLRQNGCPWSIWACTFSARGGHLEVLKWARDQDPPCPWDWATCARAAEGGQLEVLKWLRDQDPPCPWSRCKCRRRASKYGHQHVVDWIDQQEDESDVSSDLSCTIDEY